MRLTLTLALALLPSAFLAAGERDEALALIQRAIRAHGGAAALERAQALVRQGSGVVSANGQDVAFTDVVSYQLPDKARQAVQIEQRGEIVTVINGAKAWQRSGGAAMELGREFADEVRDELYVWWLATLTPLSRDEFTLTLAPAVEVAGRPAAGVKVQSKGHREVRLYFDKDNGLLTRISTRARFGGSLVNKDYLYGAFKEFNGVKLPTQWTELVNDQKQTELKSASYELRKPDDKVFNKP
jgi:hypothetical protein